QPVDHRARAVLTPRLRTNRAVSYGRIPLGVFDISGLSPATRRLAGDLAEVAGCGVGRCAARTTAGRHQRILAAHPLEDDLLPDEHPANHPTRSALSPASAGASARIRSGCFVNDLAFECDATDFV